MSETFIERLLYDRHYAQHVFSIKSLNPHSQPARLVSLLLQMRKLRHRELHSLPKDFHCERARNMGNYRQSGSQSPVSFTGS